MNAVLVSVEYTDVLRLTLPWNRDYFDQILVVTDGRSYDGVRRVIDSLNCDQNYIHVTEVFYQRGADFNKWAALEEGLDVLGRSGWLAVLDADVALPARFGPWSTTVAVGNLYTPLRLMCPTVPLILPLEETWRVYPVCGNVGEWAGYCHVFHADDPVLREKPWYDTGWKGAQGGDSLFQARWPKDKKIRPPFHVLHLGPAGVNWLGRSSAFSDGTFPEKAKERLKALRDMLKLRRRGDGYINERIVK